MAEVLNSYEPPAGRGRRQGRPPTYPWDKWASGKWWRLKRGVDFDCTVESMRVQVHRAAFNRQRFAKIEPDKEGDPDVIVIKFISEAQRERELERAK